MVKVGDFSVELVAADTKVAFKEHTASDGQVYAEVEPDMDYFISAESDIGGVIASMWVDGVDLNYDTILDKQEYNGKWEIKDGKETMTALHFNKTREARGSVTPDMLTGKVQVAFYKKGAEYYEEDRDFVSASLTADSTLGGKKCIKSTTSGSYTYEIPSSNATEDDDNEIAKYETGELLGTVTLNYCSAFGLIYHKILPPPPALEGNHDTSAAMGGRKKRKRSTPPPNFAAAAVSPQENNAAVKTENIGQETVSVQLTYDVVDLTADD